MAGLLLAGLEFTVSASWFALKNIYGLTMYFGNMNRQSTLDRRLSNIEQRLNQLVEQQNASQNASQTNQQELVYDTALEGFENSSVLFDESTDT